MTTASGSTLASTQGSTAADEGSNGEATSYNRDPAAAAGATAAGQMVMMNFEIQAGDGLTEADAADLTSILRKVEVKSSQYE